jgi:hypothetical protein
LVVRGILADEYGFVPEANEWLIVDVYGKTMLRQDVQGNQVQLNTQNLSNGTYFVRVNFVNGSSSVKSFVKQ